MVRRQMNAPVYVIMLLIYTEIIIQADRSCMTFQCCEKFQSLLIRSYHRPRVV